MGEHEQEVCPGCGFDHEAKYTIVGTLDLLHSLPSQNAIGANVGKRARAGWIYRKLKESLRESLVESIEGSVMPPSQASGYRRVWISRAWRKGKRSYDRYNLYGGTKPLVDLLIKAGILLDDRDSDCEIYTHQYKSPDGLDHIYITVEELNDER